ncbi:FAD:protein FMN transferase [Ethanoligenens harbinense]|nr:FAD:protein FMN transferase [Ethanoligenens harbinense YUAN-3]AYF39454.1 FAD:protein FMN transferase [Ethanoligenens harbinense]AYF42278.1 FAD:protein FMN transferase [Ethanoligenens harbinense]QCN93033.1 FAD:protein FMN transferase [Ethanoligenens harbinense]
MTDYETSGFGMGTIIEQRIAASNSNEGERICHRAFEVIRQLEQKMSRFIPGSFISRLNSSDGETAVKMDRDTFHVLKSAGRYYARSGGAFDITAAPLTALWRNCINQKDLPSPNTIQALRPAVSGAGVILNEKDGSARIGRHQSVDLGGIGKGYAADMVLKAYKAQGVTSACINLGGNVHTLGKKTNGESWMIGLQNPRSTRGDFIAVFAISDRSAVTSGDYEKYFESGGKRFHHIIDPGTGYPASSGLMSATVLSGSSMEADALSTAVFVSGLERGMELIEKSPGAEGVVITEEKKVFITKGIKDCFVARSDIPDYQFAFYN